MADRTIVGDTVELTNTFTVDDTATDPTTITLAVTDPSDNTTTYTYAAGTITRVSTGVYRKAVTVDEAGLWTAAWTGTGTASDIATRTFAVEAASINFSDWLTSEEADTSLGIGGSDTSLDDLLAAMITAVSERLDRAVGPVVKRTVTDELHNGGGPTIRTRLWPIYSTPAVTLVEWDGATSRTLTAEGFADNQDQDGYLLEPSVEAGLYSGVIRRRSYGADTPFAAGRLNVKITYAAGRFASTAAVPERFKQAARVTLENWWQMVRDGVGQDSSGEYLAPLSVFPSFAIPNAARQLLDDVWQGDGVDVLVI